MVKKCILAILTSLLIGVCANVFAERLVREPGREEGAPKPYIFPYGFTSESMGFVVGVAGGISGLLQEQSSLYSTALLSSGGGVFNPFKSGRTYLQTTLLHHDRDYDTGSAVLLSTTGIGLSFKYDYTDFPINPSLGSILDVGFKVDPGFGGNEGWRIAEFEYSKFFKLPHGPYADQQVLALNFWTTHTE